MKFIWMVVVGIVLACFIVAGQEQTAVAGPEEFEEAGITPDSFLWTVDLVFERVSELFSENAKLNHAQERLAEARVMIARNQSGQVERVLGQFNRVYERVENKTQLKEHKALIDNLGQKVSAIAQQGPVGEAEREEIRQLIDSHIEKVRAERQELGTLGLAPEGNEEEGEVQETDEEEATPSPTPVQNQYVGTACPDGPDGHRYCSSKIQDGQCINNKCEAPRLASGSGYAKTYYCYSTHCITKGGGVFIESSP